MASLAEIRAKLQEAQNNTGGNRSSGGDNAIYPHWNMQEGKEAVVRFLPDGNADNTFFWVERAMIKLPFAGVKGESDNRNVIVQVPCVEMYNDGTACPILSEVRPWFKDKSLEDMGRKYWKKRSYIFQGFINEDPLNEESTPENPIRRFIIGPQIFQIIKGALMDPELEELPTDYMKGVDFRIKKTSKGGYADYSTSQWSRRERALSDEEKAAVESHSLFNLNDFLPKKPSEVELKVMKEMFEASVDGEAYDMDRWGQYFRPAGMSQATGDPNKARTAAPAQPAAAPTPAPEAASAPQAEAAPAATATETPAEGGDSANRAQDILAMIRNRQQ
jgi:hypothetical protein